MGGMGSRRCTRSALFSQPFRPLVPSWRPHSFGALHFLQKTSRIAKVVSLPTALCAIFQAKESEEFPKKLGPEQILYLGILSSTNRQSLAIRERTFPAPVLP